MHVIDSGGLYGAERVLLDLAAASRDRGHRVIVCPIVAPQDESDPLGDSARALGLTVMPVTLPDGLRLRAFDAVIDVARAENVDVIHSHGYKANILFALKRRKDWPWRLVATLHGWTASRRVSKMAVYETFERMVLGRMDRVIAVSPTLRDRVPWFAGRRRVLVIPNGVAPSVVRQMGLDPRIAAFIEGRPAILAAGRLSAEKGFDVLIQAMRRVRDDFPGVRLVIAGDGAQRSELAALVAVNGLVDNVLLPGYIPDVREIMNSFRLYVLSSYREGLPAVILEAMAEGLPIVATAVGAIPEILGHGRCGRLVPPGDVQALGRSITAALLDTCASTSLAREAKQRFASQYASERMADAYLDLYRGKISGDRAVARLER